MNAATLGRYLLGNSDAIWRIAVSRNAAWLGLLFVISAGFAREYDGVYLLAEPWHLALPLAASLGTSFVLFSLLWTIAGGGSRAEVSFPAAYRSFLGLYWMTAPLAWLYAIPVERYLSAGDSMRANLTLLGIVSVWRVFLMIRVAMLLFGAGIVGAVCVVMLFADAVALAVLYLTPLPIFDIMGGIRMSEAEWIIREMATAVAITGTLTFPVWFFGTLWQIGRNRWRVMIPAQSVNVPVARGLWGVAAASVLIWGAVLPFTQREQQLRHQAEKLLRAGRISEALAFMSAHDRDDFPPHWDPPPKTSYGETQPEPIDVLETARRMELKPWVRELFIDKLNRRIGSRFAAASFWESLDEKEFDRYLIELEQVPADSPLIVEHREDLRRLIGKDSRINPDQRRRLRAIIGSDPGNPTGR